MAYTVRDTVTLVDYPVKDTRGVETAIDWILSGQDLEEYDESEIEAMLSLVNDGDLFVDSHHLGITVTAVG